MGGARVTRVAARTTRVERVRGRTKEDEGEIERLETEIL